MIYFVLEEMSEVSKQLQWPAESGWMGDGEKSRRTLFKKANWTYQLGWVSPLTVFAWNFPRGKKFQLQEMCTWGPWQEIKTKLFAIEPISWNKKMRFGTKSPSDKREKYV